MNRIYNNACISLGGKMCIIIDMVKLSVRNCFDSINLIETFPLYIQLHTFVSQQSLYRLNSVTDMMQVGTGTNLFPDVLQH